jgi:hypothetical protein
LTIATTKEKCLEIRNYDACTGKRKQEIETTFEWTQMMELEDKNCKYV